MIALTAINFAEHQKQWWFTYKSLDGSFTQEGVIPVGDEVKPYILREDAPTTGHLDVWVNGYIKDGVVWSGWKSLYSRHDVTFQVPDYVYGIDLTHGSGVSPLKPISAEEITPLAKATAISWGVILLIALVAMAFGRKRGKR